jgi:adenosylmethionine-8-amino-7-oxononanoate aminotransferase
MHEPEALAKLIKICNENQVLTIADEVMTVLVKPVKLCYGLCRCTARHDVSKALLAERYQWRLPLLPTKYLMLFMKISIKPCSMVIPLRQPTGCAAALASLSY